MSRGLCRLVGYWRMWWAPFLWLGCGSPPPPGVDSGQDDPLAHVPTAVFERIMDMGPLEAAPSDPTNRWADNEEAAVLGQHL